MDTSDPAITFDENGVCSHCLEYEKNKGFRLISDSERSFELDSLVKKIKTSSKGRDYDCLIGVSGGVDSTYVAYIVKKVFGLRPIAIHVDNGWNSNLANENIEKTLNSLDIPLKTVVLDWNEFSDLQMAFLECGTPDGEIPTDHAINAILFKEARRLKVKYVINGMNYRTEAMKVEDWAYGHADWRYIRSVYKKMRGHSLRKYPHFSLLFLAINFIVFRIRVVSILNYLDFNKEEALRTIEAELGYQKYESKHYESLYTKWFQGFFLVERFGIDKRKGHTSDLIRSNQLSREAALRIISEPALNKKDSKILSEYVLKKFRKNSDWLEEIMNNDIRSYKDFNNNKKVVGLLKNLYNLLRKFKLTSV